MRRFFSWLGSKVLAILKTATYGISRATTAVIAVGGALCGITTIRGEVNAYRPGIALMTFMIGLPFGLIIFGSAFNIFIWMAMVIGVLFLMNLHNAWEAVFSLYFGGLDYIMATQATAAAEAITPSKEDIDILNQRIGRLNKDVQLNAARGSTYNKEGILTEASTRRLIPCAVP